MDREYSIETEEKHIDSKFIFKKKNIREWGVTEKLGFCTQAEKVERRAFMQECYSVFWCY